MLGVGVLGPRPPARDDGKPASGGRPGPASPADRSRPSLAEREALAVLVAAEGLGPATLASLIAGAGSARAIIALARGPRGAERIMEAATESPAGARRPLGRAVAAEVVRVVAAADAILESVGAAGVGIVTLDDPSYPSRLRAIELPPHVLFVRGDASALDRAQSVAVVGTRRPTELGRRIGARLGTALGAAGATVVSGLAVGIDGAAHAAVVADDRSTVAVLGSGHARLFPRVHARLADAIVAAGGAVVSEFAPSVRPTRGTFPRRNRLISGLADATVVVEARIGSGALITASWALQQGRGCYLVPGSIDAPTSRGCLAFLREAEGEARIVAGIPELLEDLGLAAAATRDKPGSAETPFAPLAELGPTPRAVGRAIADGLATADELVATTGLPIATVLSAVTLLEARGFVVGAYGRYRAAGRLAGVAPARPKAR